MTLLSECVATRQRPFTPKEQLYQTSSPNIMDHPRAKFGGNMFRTKKGQAPGFKKDDSNFRVDYISRSVDGRPRQLRLFGSITRLFVHTLYPGGPERVVVEGDFYRTMPKCPVAGTHRVKVDPTFTDPLNTGSCFTFLATCYQEPVGVWPHDPQNLKKRGDPSRHWFDIIDRNQTWSGL
jgi:hypothetical protein